MFHSVFLSLQAHVLKEETRRDESRSKTTAGWKQWKGIKMEGGGEGDKRQNPSQNLAARHRAPRLEYIFLHMADIGTTHITPACHQHVPMPVSTAGCLTPIATHPKGGFHKGCTTKLVLRRAWKSWPLWKPSCLFEVPAHGFSSWLLDLRVSENVFAWLLNCDFMQLLTIYTNNNQRAARNRIMSEFLLGLSNSE